MKKLLKSAALISFFFCFLGQEVYSQVDSTLTASELRGVWFLTDKVNNKTQDTLHLHESSQDRIIVRYSDSTVNLVFLPKKRGMMTSNRKLLTSMTFATFLSMCYKDQELDVITLNEQRIVFRSKNTVYIYQKKSD